MLDLNLTSFEKAGDLLRNSYVVALRQVGSSLSLDMTAPNGEGFTMMVIPSVSVVTSSGEAKVSAGFTLRAQRRETK